MLHIHPGVLVEDNNGKSIDMAFGENEQDSHIYDSDGNLKNNPCYVPDCCIRYNSSYSRFFSSLNAGTYFPIDLVEQALDVDTTLPPDNKTRLKNMITLAKKRRANVIYIS